MTADVYDISFVLEEIHRTPKEDFILSVRFEEHEWCTIGEIHQKDLPVGFVFTTILSTFTNSSNFMLDIYIFIETSFLGRLQLSKHQGTETLSTRGISILYSTNAGNVLGITVAVKITKYYHLPTVDNRALSLIQCETQTEFIKTRSIQTQVCCRGTTVGSNTESRFLSVPELKDAVTNIVTAYLDCKGKLEAEQSIEKPALSIESSCANTRVSKPHLGKNIVSRLQKLRVLDKMIKERTLLVESFDSRFINSEIQRKRNLILRSRNVIDNSQNVKNTNESYATDDVAGKMDKIKHHFTTIASKRIIPNADLVDVPSSTSTTSTSNGSEAYSEISDLHNESSSSSATSSRTSKNDESTSSSKATVLEMKSVVDVNDQKPNVDQEKKNTPIRQKPMELVTNETSAQLSPTSLYLNELREKILRERLKRI